MPPKRKANAISTAPEEPSSPRKTVRRRVKPLNESQINSVQVDAKPFSVQHAPAHDGENYTKEHPPYPTIKSTAIFPRKEEEEDDDDDQDPIALSPSRRANRAHTPVSPSKARQILDSVEILTPSKTLTAQYAPFRDASPSRSNRHRQVQPARPQDDPQEIVISKPPGSPTKKRAIVSSPRKTDASQAENDIPNRPLSPTKHSQILPAHLIACWNAQKRAILSSLSKYTAFVDSQGQDVEDVPTNTLAYEQLSKLLEGTAERGEGNSCLLVGPRGSGKTQILERCLSHMNPAPLVIRLSGWSQLNDRAALRELATQLTQQTGTSFLPESEEDDQDEVGIPLENPAHEEEDDDDDNPFLTRPSHNPSRDAFLRSLPPPSHLPALIARIPTLSRPTVVILDAFDLFAEHPRQSLLYCLLDTAQSCRAGAGGQGLAVIGLTTRVDTINLLEKRVKSRFSGRMIRTAGPGSLDQCVTRIKDALSVPISTSAYRTPEERTMKEWERIWHAAVNGFLGDKSVKEGLADTFALSKDFRLLNRILASVVAQTSFSSPFPTAEHFVLAITAQRTRPAFGLLHSLPYPALCLLIASAHAAISGHDTVTFAQLYELFRDQLRVSTSAPVQFMGGGSIGMMKCSKEVLATSFERLVTSRYFIATGPPSASISKEFVRYRCAVDREDVKRALDRGKQTALQKWFNKALAQ